MSGSALIGWTGLIGGTLARHEAFDFRFRSTDIDDIAGRSFDLVVCAGAPAEKWRANRYPEADAAAISRLTRALEDCRIGRMIVISTIDVYPLPVGVDEQSVIAAADLQPYGRHRYGLEQFARERWPTTVVRLPAVFGSGLKKNAIFDLLHDQRVDEIDPRASYQFYDLQWLAAHLDTAMAEEVGVLNLVTEPLTIGDVAEQVFGRALVGRGPSEKPVRYDVRTVHGRCFGRTDGYIGDRAGVLAALRAFVAMERAAL